MKDTDAAYIAGLFDGEGSIYYVRRVDKKKNTKDLGIEKHIVGGLVWR